MFNLCLFKFRIVQNLIKVSVALKSDYAIKRAKNKTGKPEQKLAPRCCL